MVHLVNHMLGFQSALRWQPAGEERLLMEMLEEPIVKKKKKQTLSCSSSLSSQNEYLSTDGKQLLSAQHGQNKTSTSTKVHQSNKRALTELELLKKEKICAQWWIFLYILPVWVPGTSPCRLLVLNRGNTLSWVLNSCYFLLSTER